MIVRFYNSFTKRLEDFEPLRPPHVGLYTCGPTVHDYAHIGNFRTFAWEDLLRRHLEYRGFAVHHVMNVTDVEDKIIHKAALENAELGAFTRRFTAAFLEDSATLRIQAAHVYPRATEHIAEMIALIQKLERGGLTYVSDGSVYYRIGAFAAYGRLMGFERDQLRAGARVDADEYDKDDPADFVLWKAHRPGEPVWDSPWGPGRPGWHIECSAMSMKYLGETFDIHTGGIDNKFPHHENEIAQSEGATGRPFVRYWLHAAHLVVDGEKMSKSLGNFFTLRDLVAQGRSPRVLRYLLIGTHYRKTINFTADALEQCRGELQRIDDCRARLARETAGRGRAGRFAQRAREAEAAFGACLDDDLNVSGAMGELFTLVREINSALDRGELDAGDADALDAVFRAADRVFGCILPWDDPAEAIDPAVQALVHERTAARQARNWAESDRLRDELLAHGWLVEDTAQGAVLKRKPR